MTDSRLDSFFEELVEGRTELVFDLIASGCPADASAPDGVSLARYCAYYGDVSAIRFLLANLWLDEACTAIVGIVLLTQ